LELLAEDADVGYTRSSEVESSHSFGLTDES